VLFRSAIKNDAAITAHCVANFGRAPGLYVGFDSNDPPPENQHPWLAVVPSSSAIDDELKTREYELQIGFGAFYSTVDAASTSGITKHVGYSKVYKLVELVQERVMWTLHPNENNPTCATTVKDLGRPSVDFSHPRYLASWTIRAASAF
jgi:hypothetical protein